MTSVPTVPGIRWALVEALMGQAMAQANVMWHEVERDKGSCADEVGELIELMIAAAVQLEHVKACLARKGK